MFTNWLTSQQNTLPPDILLEIGPPPFTRFAAHSSLLSVHSGYLRAAIRSEETNINGLDIPIYFLPNITAEQFAPLLTYMYTGYLDLSIENIFGVLLATHLLHMPRALELCRSFLSSTQIDGGGGVIGGGGGYIGGIVEGGLLPTFINSENYNNSGNQTVKIIRPIPSKATGNGIGFISSPTSHILLSSRDTSFKTILTAPSLITTSSSITTTAETTLVEKRHRSPIPSTSKASLNTPDEQTHQQREIHHKKSLKLVRKLSRQLSPATEENKFRLSSNTATSEIVTNCVILSQQEKERERELRKSVSPPSDAKIIIDVASCDGPVRFRRVLNDAYGRFPHLSQQQQQTLPISETTSTSQTTTSIESSQIKDSNLIDEKQQKRHQLILNTSFHQQMARNIIERNNQSAEESENSEDTNHYSLNQNEIFTCVYCKHTFKSQYCYQKHAKRHLNPLSIDNCDNIIEIPEDDKDKCEKSQKCEKTNEMPVTLSITATSSIISTTSTITSSTSIISTGNNNKREVRPLDMNVQYYPCKTCGSKFPSYYFVHKHRKLCHSNEEN